MPDELLVRLYRVGCGDCIFLRVPDEGGPRHILVDCGNFLGDPVGDLRSAVSNVVELLNDPEIPAAQRGQLDLLVATHQHWDHLKGFEGALEALKGFAIRRIWITIAMKEDHAGAQGLHALQAGIAETVKGLVEERGRAISPLLYAMLVLSLSTGEASRALRQVLSEHNHIEPLYVYRGVEGDLAKKKRASQLLSFGDTSTRLSILAPEKEIDEAYTAPATGLLGELEVHTAGFLEALPEDQRLREPANISASAFRLLRSQLMHTSLLAASQENSVVNNTSVALLLEWRGRRLLFPGDAEHESWKLMWQNARQALSRPLDFLKVSHHGSQNGTPYELGDAGNPINEILDTVLPRGNAGNARAVVSTLAGRIHAPIHPVPFPELMNELAERVSNALAYPSGSGRQPQRTDLEQADWIDVRFAPA
jgi:beta-lactamase superfamily II metal-dependent hydrolase